MILVLLRKEREKKKEKKKAKTDPFRVVRSLGPLVARLPSQGLSPLLEKLSYLTVSQSVDISVPNTALRTIIAALPKPQPGLPPSQESVAAYAAVSLVLIPRLTGPTPLPTSRRGSIARGMLEKDPVKGFSSDAMDVLIEVVNCFGPLLKEAELVALEKCVMSIIDNDTAPSVVVKRALTAIAALVVHFSDAQLNTFVSELIDRFRSANLSVDHRRHLIATLSSLARKAPAKLGPYLDTLTPFVLAPVSEQEMDDASSDIEDHDTQTDELRETALVTLEALMSACGRPMLPYLPEAINSALRYLKYDPNVAEVEEDEEMGGTQDDGSDDIATDGPNEDDDNDDDDDDAFGDFGEGDDEDAAGGYSDIDDMSWKIRRCATKVLYTVITTYGHSRDLDDAVLYQQIAPALISRICKEREESVKLDVVSTLTALVRKTSEGSDVIIASSSSRFPESVGGSKNSRKRRRQDSDASMIDFEPSLGTSSAISSPIVAPSTPKAGPQADLARLVPTIVQRLARSWKQSSVSFRQAAIVLLKSLALVRYGALAEFLQQIEDPIADALKASSSTAFSSLSGTTSSSGTVGAAVSAGTLQIEALGLIAAIAETHISDALLPFLIALIPGVITAVDDRNYKVNSEALGAIEQIIKALTPPRVTGASPEDLKLQLEKLYDVVIGRITNTAADLEVRQRAIHVLGVLLARTSGGERGLRLLAADRRSRGLAILVDRLRNETTRLSAIRAVDDVAVLASDKADVSATWVSEVTAELGAQLRKSDRALRSGSLETLRSLAMNPFTRAHYDASSSSSAVVKELESNLLPLINGEDFNLLAPALIILAKLLPGNAVILVNENLISALCLIAQTPLVGTVLKAMLLLVRVIGEQGAGAGLMKRLLRDVGVNGDPAVVGRAIGTLLVYGGLNSNNLGVKMEDFLAELQAAVDSRRKCLALAILGEVGLRMGSQCALSPDTFTPHFYSTSDKVRLAAATALGNAAAGSVKAYLPVIMEGLDKSSPLNYLLLHSVKEMLQHPEIARSEIASAALSLWRALLVVSEEEDNRAVGAECIGRLALIDPAAYIPEFQVSSFQLHEWVHCFFFKFSCICLLTLTGLSCQGKKCSDSRRPHISVPLHVDRF